MVSYTPQQGIFIEVRGASPLAEAARDAGVEVECASGPRSLFGPNCPPDSDKRGCPGIWRQKIVIEEGM